MDQPTGMTNKCYLCNKNRSSDYYISESNKKSIRFGTIHLLRNRLFCSEKCMVFFNKNCKCKKCNCEIDGMYEYVYCFDCVDDSNQNNYESQVKSETLIYN
jgi:hypothetical protein